MKTARTPLLAVVLLSALNVLAQSPSRKSFDLVKSLAGSWEGNNRMGDPIQVSYRVTAGGSGVMSEIVSQMQGKQEDMISVIHMDRRPSAAHPLLRSRQSAPHAGDALAGRQKHQLRFR